MPQAINQRNIIKFQAWAHSNVHLQYLLKDPLHQRVLISIIGAAPITKFTHVRNKNSNTQGSSPNVVNVISHTTRNCS